MKEAFGIIETYGLVAAVRACDTSLKSANVVLESVNYVRGGIVSLTFRGDVGAIKSCIDSGVAEANRGGVVLGSSVIPRLDNQVDKIISNFSNETTISKKHVSSVNNDDVKKQAEAKALDEQRKLSEIKKAEEEKKQALAKKLEEERREAEIKKQKENQDKLKFEEEDRKLEELKRKTELLKQQEEERKAKEVTAKKIEPSKPNNNNSKNTNNKKKGKR